MSVNKNIGIKDSALNKMLDLAYRGQHEDTKHTDSALKLLNRCKLSEEQSAKIASILGNIPSENAALATAEMKGKILAVLNGEDIEINNALEVAPVGPTTLFHSNELIDDILQQIFLACQSKLEWEGIGAFGCLNTLYNKFATKYWEKFDLKLFCPELTILDLKTQEAHEVALSPPRQRKILKGFKNVASSLGILNTKKQGIAIDAEDKVSKLAIAIGYRDLAPNVENNEGVTLLTLEKGFTNKRLIKFGEKSGIDMRCFDQLLKEIGNVPVKQTYVILITNSVFKESRIDALLGESGSHQSYFCRNEEISNLHKRLVEVKHGCEIPIPQEYLALCVLTYKCFQKCPYGRNPVTYGSTYIGDHPLFIGGFGNGVGDDVVGEMIFLNIRDGLYNEASGIGGRRKLKTLGA